MSQPGGSGQWLADVRPRVFNKIMSELARIYQGQPAPFPQELHTLAVKFEERVFREATSKEDYMRNIANMINVEKKQRQEQQQQQLLQVTQGLQEQIHMGGQMLLANAVQAIQGGNSSVTAMPQVTPMASPGRPSSQLQSLPMTQQNSGLVPNQHMAYPSAADMQIKVNQEQPGMMAVLDHIPNFQPPKVAPMALGVQPSQRPMQSVEAQSQNQHLSKQLQPTNFAGCNPTSMTQLQGQPIVRPSVQQNHLLWKNASGIATQQLQQQEQELQLMRMNQQNWRDNQQQMDRQRYQMIGSQQADVTKMQIGHPGGRNNQQNARRTDVLQSPFKAYEHDTLRKQINMKPEPRTPPQRHIAGGQQSSLLCQRPQTSATMGSAGEADWREEMLQKIKSLKDACFSELMEFDQTVNVPKITKEHFYSLPREKADRIKYIAKLKDTIRNVLNFLQLPKSNIPEGLKGQFPQIQTLVRNLVHLHRKRKVQNADVNTGRQVQNCREQPQIINLSRDSAPFTGGMSRQQNQQEQPADASISLLGQTIGTRTPPARQQNHRNHLLGLSSPCFPIKSPGALQSLPTNKLEVCCTPSPIAKTGSVQVATPRASVKSTSPSPIVKPGVVQVASPRASVKSTSPSPIAKPAVVSVASPGALVKSTLPSPIAKPVVVQVASPCASVKSTLPEDCDSFSAFLLHDNGTAAPNGSNHVTPTKVMMSASQLQAETPAGQAEDQVRGGAETPVAKKPIDRLVDAVLSSSPAALRSSANYIWSVLSMSDCVPHGEVGTFQDWTFSQQRGGSSTLNKMKRVFDHTTSRSESPPLGSMDGSCVTVECDASDSESSGKRIAKRQKTQNANDVLWEEIKAINSTLIDTVISITGDNGTDGISCNGGTTIELSYTAVSLAPSLKSLLATSEMSLVMPAKLFVPSDYPRSSPVLLNYQGEDQLRKLTDISDVVGVTFRRAVSDLPEPRSIKGTARAWDACVRRAVTEFADQLGGGTFSWRLSRWES